MHEFSIAGQNFAFVRLKPKKARAFSIRLIREGSGLFELFATIIVDEYSDKDFAVVLFKSLGKIAKTIDAEKSSALVTDICELALVQSSDGWRPVNCNKDIENLTVLYHLTFVILHAQFGDFLSMFRENASNSSSITQLLETTGRA